MKIALIYPPYYHHKHNENLSTVDEEFGQFPYISFGFLAREAEKLSIETHLFDIANIRSIKKEDWIKNIREYAPDLLAYPAHSAQTIREMIEWALFLKDEFKRPQLVGGYEAKHSPSLIMSHACFDYLCAGEILPFFPKFISAFLKKIEMREVPDLYYRANNQIAQTFSSKKITLEELGYPDRSIFTNQIFRSHVSERKNFTIGISSNGCPYPCDFCDIAETKFESRTPVSVYEEMRECRTKFHIREIDWFDPVMFYERSRIDELCTLLIREPLDMIWSARTRIDTLSKKNSQEEADDIFIAKLAHAGCRRLFLGIESANPLVQEEIHKKINQKLVRSVLLSLKKYKIYSLGFFMIGNPSETKETVEQTIQYARSLPLSYAQFSLTIMKPHSKLVQRYSQKKPLENYWKNYIEGKINERELDSPWTILTRKEQEKLSRKAYLRFYFRTGYILNVFFRAYSMRRMWHYLKVSLKIIFQKE